MQNLRLTTIWYATKSKNSHVNFHSHKYHELVYYPSGHGQTKVGDRCFVFRDHTFVLIPPNTPHNEVHDADSEVICLRFSGADHLSAGFFTDREHAVFKILKELLSEAADQKYGYEDMLVVKLNELLVHIYRMENNAASTKNFQYIIHYLQENFHEPIRLADCAEQLHISYDYFQHKFKAITGVSPRQFLMERRLEAGKSMLQDGIYNCTEIAQRCGFCTSAQFSSLFKKRYGISPLQYRKA